MWFLKNKNSKDNCGPPQNALVYLKSLKGLRCWSLFYRWGKNGLQMGQNRKNGISDGTKWFKINK